MNQCTTCWHEVSDEAVICPECGERIGKESMRSVVGSIWGGYLWLGKWALVLFIGVPVVTVVLASIEIAGDGDSSGVGLVFALLGPFVIAPGVVVGWILGQIISKRIKALKSVESNWKKDVKQTLGVLIGVPVVLLLFDWIGGNSFWQLSSGAYFLTIFIDSVLLVFGATSIWAITQRPPHERKNDDDRRAGTVTADSARGIRPKGTIVHALFPPLWHVIKWLLIMLIGFPFVFGLIAGIGSL